VPDLLSSSQPEEIRTEDWKNTMGFQYHYDTYLPSIMTSFIVKMYGYQEGRKYWKNGIVLKYRDSLALVRAERADKKLLISIKGNNLRDNQYLLSAIRKELREIHGRFVELEVIEKVPHPQYLEVVRDYADLIFAEEIGEESIPIKELKRKVPIKEFLDGIISAEARSDEAKSQMGDTHIHIHGDRSTAIVGLKNSSVAIDTGDFDSNKLEKLLSNLDIDQENLIRRFADEVVGKLLKEKLPENDQKALEVVEKGKWETKLETVIPIIPKIPWLGEFFPSMSLKTTRTITKDEFISGVRRFYGDEPLTNILNASEEPDNKLLGN
jgi:hypothetical protein